MGGGCPCHLSNRDVANAVLIFSCSVNEQVFAKSSRRLHFIDKVQNEVLVSTAAPVLEPLSSRCPAFLETWRALAKMRPRGNHVSHLCFLSTSNIATGYEDIYTVNHVGNEFAARLEFLTHLRASGTRTRGVL
jgi:hypothetical protein